LPQKNHNLWENREQAPLIFALSVGVGFALA